ncbi:conserved hypothetical protein [Ricinus communis]|uniref:Uncharacterized protein n=1 Tax=Ricinus communis TaxID=3988 RepID=B9SQ99_RICCO|nr:conserved hypothetical protein [Ricinus communis]
MNLTASQLKGQQQTPIEISNAMHVENRKNSFLPYFVALATKDFNFRDARKRRGIWHGRYKMDSSNKSSKGRVIVDSIGNRGSNMCRAGFLS